MHSSHVVASLAGALAAGACGTVVGLRPATPDVLAQRDVVLVFYRGHW